MRKRNVKAELNEFPCYEVINGKLVRIPPPKNWYGLHLHHYITTQWQQNNPEKFEQVRHLQKLIFMPPQMHMELHAKHSKFKEKYGIDIKELLFDWREYMISAKQAREKSDANSVKITREEIEKSIEKAIAKGSHSVFKSGQIPSSIKEELLCAGYELEECPTGLKVMW